MRISDWSSDVFSSDLGAQRCGHARLLVDDDLPRHSHHRLLLRVEERSLGMGVDVTRTGVMAPSTAPVAQDAYFNDMSADLSDRGFVVAKLDEIGRASWRARVCQYV